MYIYPALFALDLFSKQNITCALISTTKAFV